MLGDGHIQLGKTSRYPQLRLEQTYPGHAQYLIHLFTIFFNLTTKLEPRIKPRNPDKRTGKVYTTIAFQTRSIFCLVYWYKLFYLNGVKIVPANIASLMTAVSLAYWIMDDGSITHYGQTVLHTNAFTPTEVKLLQSALFTNFKLRTRVIQKLPDQQLIVIPLKQEVSLKSIVGPYIHDSIKFKVRM